MPETQPQAVEANNRFAPITLSAPIMRGETKIEALTLRKPKAGELRGLDMQDILTSDVAAVLKLIPRVTDPPLTRDEADDLEADDFAEMCGAIRNFFMTKTERKVFERVIAEHLPKT